MCVTLAAVRAGYEMTASEEEVQVRVDRGDVVAILDGSLPVVYDYLLRRVGDRQQAEDLTSETMLAALTAVRDRGSEIVSVGWLIGIARHKLIDHWRAREREQRRLRVISSGMQERHVDEPFEESGALRALAQLNPWQRAALTLRYVDGLSVPEVAAHIGRSVGATEVLLVRAKRAFRQRYSPEGLTGDE